jgi:hypothetical protein
MVKISQGTPPSPPIAWFISCHIDIHRHFIRVLQKLISIVDVFSCNNVQSQGPKFFLCLWHVRKTWAKNVIRKFATVED